MEAGEAKKEKSSKSAPKRAWTLNNWRCHQIFLIENVNSRDINIALLNLDSWHVRGCHQRGRVAQKCSSALVCHGRREMLEGLVCSADLFNGLQKYFYEKPHLDNLSSPDNRCSGDKTVCCTLLVRHRWLQLCQKGCRVAYLGLVITTFFHLSMYT